MSGTAKPSASAWAPLRSRIFLVIWIATLASNIGTSVRDVASGWLMTDLSPTPLMVSLVQAAATLPIFILSLPAGAIADIVDRRRLLIGVQVLLLGVAAALTAAAHLSLMSPALLLGLTVVGGVGAALAGPAFQAIVPELVGRSELRSAVALNSLGVNVARAIGPAIGGLLVATASAAAAYLFDALSYLLIIVAFVWWRRPVQSADLPPEAFIPAMQAGARYAHRSSDLKRVLLRAAIFFVFASAYWALLPLIARERLQAGAPFYGILLSAIGAGAVSGALLLPRLRLRADLLVFSGTLVTAAITAALAMTEQRWIALILLFVAGAAWITVLTNLNVRAHAALPSWVRARGLAIYLMTFFGAMTVGSALWGLVAQALTIQTALLVAGAGGALTGLLGVILVRLPAADPDLSPSNHWSEAVTTGPVDGERGPVLVSLEYIIDPSDRTGFLIAAQKLAAIRARDGAYGWRVFEDAADPRRYVEMFFAASWLEHLRQHRRVTNVDALAQSAVNAFHRGEHPPRVQHLLSARPSDQPGQPIHGHVE